MNHLDSQAIQANTETNLRARLSQFPGCRPAIERELAALECRQPKTAEKQIEWAARVAGFRAVLA